MKDRILLKEIPPGKFDSAIFTTYSFNFYYFEQQVLSMLGSKGITYVSVLVDGAMLNRELDLYCSLSDQRKRGYSIHGIQSNGSFHPKLIYLTGESSILILIGSGNLTSAGHGKNLESWNAIYINSPRDEKMGFAKQCWDYIKSLHSGLGRSAKVKLETIEGSCSLFKEMGEVSVKDLYFIHADSSVAFLSSPNKESLFTQLINLIGDEPIQSVTVMCPYYDIDGRFLKLINGIYKPQRIDVILQSQFGQAPINLAADTNMYFYDWEEIKSDEIKQNFFHAKNIVLEGEKFDFLLTGSANASIAAFGGTNYFAINAEACVLYRNSKTNFQDLLGIELGANHASLAKFEHLDSATVVQNEYSGTIFIRAIEETFNKIQVYWFTEREDSVAIFCLFNTKGKITAQFELRSKKGGNEILLSVPPGTKSLYGTFFQGNNQISNKQFVIDTISFEKNNPSPGNRAFNQIRKIIEGGSFSTPKIIDYLSTLYSQQSLSSVENSIKTSVKNDYESPVFNEDKTLFFLSYEQIQVEISKLSQTQKERTYVNYRSVQLWDSIFAYLREARQKEEEGRIDEEETENTDTSRGRGSPPVQSNRRRISLSEFQRLQKKIETFLCGYWDTLESKINNDQAGKPNLIDLSMYLIVIEILLHLVGHKETLEENEDEKSYLLNLKYSKDEYSWSEYLVKITGLFTLWCSRKHGFEESTSNEYTIKTELYKQMAFRSSIAALSLLPFLNDDGPEFEIVKWTRLSLLNIHNIFNNNNISTIENYIEFVPKVARDELGEHNIEEQIVKSLKTIDDLPNLTSNGFYLHKNDGYGHISKIVTNRKNISVRYLKLINTGYQWHEDLEDYWNGRVYSPSENRWISVKNHSS